MEFFSTAITTLSTIIIAIGGGLAVWGVVNLLEGYGNDNPGAKSQGMKQLMAGAGLAIIGITLVPQLSSLLSTSSSVTFEPQFYAMADNVISFAEVRANVLGLVA